jgi:hypothetical protein
MIATHNFGRHPREGGGPQASGVTAALGSRFRGNDEDMSP